jgi:hypothetical protein
VLNDVLRDDESTPEGSRRIGIAYSYFLYGLQCAYDWSLFHKGIFFATEENSNREFPQASRVAKRCQKGFNETGLVNVEHFGHYY